MFKLTIETENEAFRENKRAEVIRILKDVCRKLESYDSGTLRDVNGNMIGKYTLTET